MYIFDPTADTLPKPPSLTTMNTDSQDEIKRNIVLQPDSSVKKRKRNYEPDESPQIAPLNILSGSYLLNASSLPTPTASTTSFLSETVHLGGTPPHLTRVNSTGSNFPLSKRVQLTPTPRIRPLPARSCSDSTVNSLVPNLYPCHLCHRRPTTLQDLPAYANCESCLQRTCFICLRSCEGPRCHLQLPQQGMSTSSSIDATKGRNICGKCCVEVGVEGRVWCIACYEDDAEEELYSQGPTKKEIQSERVHRVADWLEGCGDEEQ